MIKSMTYKIGPLEKCDDLSVAIDKNQPKEQNQSIKTGQVNDAYNLHSDSDSIVKDYDDISNENQKYETDKNKIDQIIIVSSSKSPGDTFEEDQRDHLSNSDTASSNESGFGTVDDELENDAIGKQTQPSESKENSDKENKESQSAVITYQPLGQRLNEDSAKEVSFNNSSSQQSDNINKYPQSIKLPTLQGPRQIIYELNSKGKRNSDDNANILHDNSSINSSSSSDDTGGHHSSNCCIHTLISRLNKCYYNCLCCYPSWLSIFCCCCPILGCISLYLTNRSKKLKLNQKYALAEKYSSYAEKLNIASLIFGVILYAIAVFLITLIIFMHWRHENRS